MSTEGCGDVEIFGMNIDEDVIPCVTFALDNKCGRFTKKDMMFGELKTEEMLAVNPFGQMPSMKDGSYCLAESGAILRYLANSYAIEAYGGFDAKARAEIDWALDWVGTNFVNNLKNIWYPVVGFGTFPDDQDAANKDAVANLGTFEKKFLAGGKKFVGGNTMTIADYKFGCWVWYLNHLLVKEKTGFELPTRFKKYVEDYQMAVSDESNAFLADAKGFMDLARMEDED
jgi:glutathione S-transferase